MGKRCGKWPPYYLFARPEFKFNNANVCHSWHLLKKNTTSELFHLNSLVTYTWSLVNLIQSYYKKNLIHSGRDKWKFSANHVTVHIIIIIISIKSSVYPIQSFFKPSNLNVNLWNISTFKWQIAVSTCRHLITSFRTQ